MNQVLTGKFIADEREKKGYTQTDLADKLGISNRTVSKNELLSGERLGKDDYEKRAEVNMVQIIAKNGKV